MTTTNSSSTLTEDEIVFLNGLSSSELRNLLADYPSQERSQIRATLKAAKQKQKPQESDQQKNEPASVTVKQGQRRNDAGTQARNFYQNRQRRALQEISPLPENLLGDAKKVRRKCDKSLRYFLAECFPNAFPLAFSQDHERLIQELDDACKLGRLKALALPRGSGKTTIVLRAGLWAILTGLRRFCVLIAATEAASQTLLENVKVEIQSNPKLATLYARELHALRSLDGEGKRSHGQRFNDAKTNVAWLADRINFGNVPGVATSGAMLNCCGLTGNIRGQQTATNAGEILRPDLVLIDDPQTSESAASPTQCQKRYEIMMGDVLGMSGPGKTIAAVTACTVVYEGDLAARILDRKVSPAWRGDKCQLVNAWPHEIGQEHWDNYRDLYENDQRSDGDGSIPRAYIEENFEVMHDGAQVAWEERKNPGELSALQHAYHLRFRDEPAFFAEYQNEPISVNVDRPFNLNADRIAHKTNGAKRGTVPEYCERLTTFVDVQNKLLYFTTVAWEMNGRGHVVEYGTFPDQRRIHFQKTKVEKTLQDKFETENLGEAIYAGLDYLTGLLFKRKYRRADGAVMTMDRVAVDARSGAHTRTVRRFCRECPHVGRIHPHFGQFIGKDSKQWASWQHKKGDRLGLHFRLQPPPKNTRGVREILVDTNWWKSKTAEKLEASSGSESAILLHDWPPNKHRMFSEHQTAESPFAEVGKAGNRVIIWKHQFAARDNDFFDCLVGNCVLASIEGIGIEQVPEPSEARKQKPQKRKRRAKSYVEL